MMFKLGKIFKFRKRKQSSLSKEALDTHKHRLEQEKKRLLKEIGKKKPEDFGSDVEDSSEETDEAEELVNTLAIVQTLRDRVNEIDAALSRIGAGEYAVCEQCEKDIEEKILGIAPESRLCGTCKRGR